MTELLRSLLASADITSPLEEQAAARLAEELTQVAGWRPYPRSLVGARGLLLFLGRRGADRRLCLLWDQACVPAGLAAFSGERVEISPAGARLGLLAGPLDHGNAAALRALVPFTAPKLLGVRPAIGCGDRLGIATPAHVQAVRGTGLRPAFAQQSIREMTRTGRTPEQVLDTATFGVFQEGWREGFGADADHLKTTEDVDATVAAGFTMFTIDPGDHVEDAAHSADASALEASFQALPWEALATTPEDLRRTHARPVRLPDDSLVALEGETLIRAAVKYGRALAHTAAMYRHLVARMGGRPFELEMSVDETAAPTTQAEHVFVVRELHRLGVSWVSLAPRFVGEFEKGVDYRGNLDEFARSFSGHVAVAREFGPYKVSIHSGSDKFSIYPIAARLAGDLVHLKTAGTSYLEALRAIARVDPGLFREILEFAIARYPTDRASYHVSADPAQMLRPEGLRDEDLPAALDHFHTREALHVTFGSVLSTQDQGRPRFRDRLMAVLAEHEEVHYQSVRAHLARHLAPFAGAS